MSGSKNWYIYTMEYYTAERKKELLPFATAWIDLESIMLNAISQVVKDEYFTYLCQFMVFHVRRQILKRVNCTEDQEQLN